MRGAAKPDVVAPTDAGRSAAGLSCRCSTSQAAGAATDGRTTRRMGTAYGSRGERGRTGACRVRTKLSASSSLGTRRRLSRYDLRLFARARWVRVPQHLSRMASPARLRRAIPVIRADLSEAYFGEPCQALSVLHRRGAANGPAQHQPVQGRPATCLEIRLVPHAWHRRSRRNRCKLDPRSSIARFASQCPLPKAQPSFVTDLCSSSTGIPLRIVPIMRCQNRSGAPETRLGGPSSGSPTFCSACTRPSVLAPWWSVGTR